MRSNLPNQLKPLSNRGENLDTHPGDTLPRVGKPKFEVKAGVVDPTPADTPDPGTPIKALTNTKYGEVIKTDTIRDQMCMYYNSYYIYILILYVFI